MRGFQKHCEKLAFSNKTNLCPHQAPADARLCAGFADAPIEHIESALEGVSTPARHFDRAIDLRIQISLD